MRGLATGLALGLWVALAAPAWAQAPNANAPADSGSQAPPPWYALAFQQTVVTQGHEGFRAAYSGPNSLHATYEVATSLTSTLFFTARLTDWLKGYVSPEIAGGSGVSLARGAGGFMNGETFRVGNPTPTLYLARGYLQATRKWGADGSFHLEAGKFSLADFFDLNAASHDPRSRFLNWALMSNGAWDYPANVRGYTVGVVAGVSKGHWALQAAVTQEPKYANGAQLDNQVGVNRGHVAELARTWNEGGARPGAIRLLGFLNLADMGSYAQAIAVPAGDTVDVTSVRRQGRTKYGLGLSADQRLGGGLVLFGRAGYSDGLNETWAFTEIDHSVSLGGVLEGQAWRRPRDLLGLAVAANGLSPAHRRYLERGGLGFMLGDGRLRYGPEAILELFYLMTLPGGHFFVTPDFQFVLNPGYNQDRGPANVFALRFHTEF